MTKYVVQYELEFDDRLSVNDTVEVYADSAEDAISKFNNDKSLCREILRGWHDSLAITANAAWLA